MTGGQNFGPSWAIQALSLGHFVVFPLYCGFWSSRILLYFPLSVSLLVRPSVIGVTSQLFSII